MCYSIVDCLYTMPAHTCVEPRGLFAFVFNFGATLERLFGIDTGLEMICLFYDGFWSDLGDLFFVVVKCSRTACAVEFPSVQSKIETSM